MIIQVNTSSVQPSQAILDRVNKVVNRALRFAKDRVTRVEVYLRDVNGPRSGVDKRCLIEARIGGLKPVMVEHASSDLYEAISAASSKLHRRVDRTLARRRTR